MLVQYEWTSVHLVTVGLWDQQRKNVSQHSLLISKPNLFHANYLISVAAWASVQELQRTSVMSYHLYHCVPSNDGALSLRMNKVHSLFLQTLFNFSLHFVALSPYFSLSPSFSFTLALHHHHSILHTHIHSFLTALVSGRIILPQSGVCRLYDLRRGTVVNHVQTALLL